MAHIDKDLLKILACPKCRNAVVEEGDSIRCTNKQCGLLYPVREGIPVMLLEEAAR